MARIATLEEIERHWSILDLLDAHEVLDIQQEYEEYMQESLKLKIPGV